MKPRQRGAASEAYALAVIVAMVVLIIHVVGWRTPATVDRLERLLHWSGRGNSDDDLTVLVVDVG